MGELSRSGFFPYDCSSVVLKALEATTQTLTIAKFPQFNSSHVLWELSTLQKIALYGSSKNLSRVGIDEYLKN
jgi:hypothetical protein